MTPHDSHTCENLLRPLKEPLDQQASRCLGVAVEVSVAPGLLTHDLDHSAIPDTSYVNTIQQVAHWLRAFTYTPDTRSIHDSARRLRDARVARDLLDRQHRLERGRLVYLRGQPFLQEPQSENDLLALYFKLEGADALPFEECRVLEHTPSRGIDAIGHFQIDAADARHQYALIEFEHRFASFLAHGHSLRHVDLVICWSISDADPLRQTNNRWLMKYSDPALDKIIPVLILSRNPYLEVKNA